MAEWRDYRMWYRRMYGVANGGLSASYASEWKPSDNIFRARSQQEAQKKADKFWHECQFGEGSSLCIPADETLSAKHFQEHTDA